MPAVVNVQYNDSSQRVATVRADITFGDPVSDRFAMPGFSPVVFVVDGATGAATYTNAELQAAARTTDPDMVRVPGVNAAADGAVLAPAVQGFEMADYRFAIAATAGVVRVTAVFVRTREC